MSISVINTAGSYLTISQDGKDFLLPKSELRIYTEGDKVVITDLFGRTYSANADEFIAPTGNASEVSTQIADFAYVNLEVGVDGTKNVTIQLIENATLGGTPSYTQINTNNSIMEYDIAGTTVTGGRVLQTYIIDKTGEINDTYLANILDQIYVAPNRTLTIAAFSVNSSDVTAAINWREDIN